MQPSEDKTFTYDELREAMVEYIQTVDDTSTEALDAFLKMLDPNRTYTTTGLRHIVVLMKNVEGAFGMDPDNPEGR